MRSGLVTGGVVLAVLALGGGSVAATTATTSPGGSESSSPSPSAGTPDDLSTAQTSSEGVEVSTYGTVTVRPYQQADNPPVVAAVHGVHRVEGATVVYYSMGWSGEEPDRDGLSELSAPGATNGGYTDGGAMAAVRVVDLAGGQVYRTVADPETSGVAPSPFGSPTSAFPEEAGVMGTMYAVLPELPESTDVVDVDLVFGVTVPDVPVQDGLLEPAADPSEVVPLGTGWPEVDESKLADIETEGFVFPIAAVTEALDNSQVVTEEGETITIDLAADVLFAFDEADLSAAAQAKLAEITQKLIADEATGAVSIVGHTDSEGSDSYNLDLSSRRAASVAAVLTPALATQSLTFAVDGRGEAEPVADNSSEEGRQANRRVTITYTTGG